MDAFSRRVWAEPIRSKEAGEIVKALRRIYDGEGETPAAISTDYGKEFLNSKVAEFLKEFRIQLILSQSPQKAMQAESSIRTLRALLRKMKRSSSQPSHWPKLLQPALDIINSRKSRLTGLPPKEITANNAAKVFASLYPSMVGKAQPPLSPSFSVGDFVRLIRPVQNLFAKGSKRLASKDIYRVLFHPILIEYRVKDPQTGDIVAGKYTEEDLLLVKLPLENF